MAEVSEKAPLVSQKTQALEIYAQGSDGRALRIHLRVVLVCVQVVEDGKPVVNFWRPRSDLKFGVGLHNT